MISKIIFLYLVTLIIPTTFGSDFLKEGIYDLVYHGPDIFKKNSFQKKRDYSPVYIDPLAYDLKLKFLENPHRLSGRLLFSFKSEYPLLSEIKIDAVDFDIQKVELGNNGEPLLFSYDKSELTLYFHKPLSVNEVKSIVIYYETSRSDSFYGVYPDWSDPHRENHFYTYTQPEGAREWFPSIDRPLYKAKFFLELELPQKYTLLSNGDSKFILEEEKGIKRYFFKMFDPMATYLFSLAIAPYEIQNLGEFKNKKLSLYAPANRLEEAALEAVETEKMVETFSSYIGVDYPFNSYSQSVAAGYGTSMEHQTASTMGGVVMSGDGTGVLTVIHELGHQWFGDYVTCESWGDLWLNEGFATYSSLLYPELSGQMDHVYSQKIWWRDDYFNEIKDGLGHPLSVPSQKAYFDNHSYDKGALVLNLIRHWVNHFPGVNPNKETFSEVLKYYLTKHGGKNVNSRDLQRSIEEITKISWDQFFNTWVFQTGHPVLEKSMQVKPLPDGRYQVSLEISQTQKEVIKDAPKAFSFPLEVEFVNGTHQSVVKEIMVSKEKEIFVFLLNFLPSAAALDPDLNSLIEIDKRDINEDYVLANFSNYPLVRFYAYQSLIKNSDIDISFVINEKDPFVLAKVIDLLIEKEKDVSFINSLVELLPLNPKIGPFQNHYLLTPVWNFKAYKLKKEYLKMDFSEKERIIYDLSNQVLTSSHTIEKRILLNLISELNHELFLEFLPIFFHSPKLVDRDRRVLMDLLAKESLPLAIDYYGRIDEVTSYDFLKVLLKGFTKYQNQSETLIDGLDKLILTNRFYGIRYYAIKALGSQEKYKDYACEKLSSLKLNFDFGYYQIFLKDELERAISKLHCPRF